MSNQNAAGPVARLVHWLRDPVRRITLIVLGIAAVVFAWYVVADRITPYTTQARVDALTVPLVPQVSGYVTRLDVRLHSVVREGDTLLQLDQRPFDLAVQSAQAALDDAVQQVGAGAGGAHAGRRTRELRGTAVQREVTSER